MVTVIPSIWPAVAWVLVVLRMELPAARRTPISLIRLSTETSVVLVSPDRAMTRVAPRTRQTIQGQPCGDG